MYRTELCVYDGIRIIEQRGEGDEIETVIEVYNHTTSIWEQVDTLPTDRLLNTIASLIKELLSVKKLVEEILEPYGPIAILKSEMEEVRSKLELF